MSAAAKKQQLGEYLISKKQITIEQLTIALREQSVSSDAYHRERLGDILVHLGFLRRKQLIEALSEINPDALSEDISGAETEVPSDYLRKTRTIIKGDTGATLFVATLSDDPYGVQRTLAEITKREVRLVPASLIEIYSRLARGEQDIQEANRQDLHEEDDVNELIQALLNEAVHKRATDIHIETTDRSTHIRYRIDSMLYDTHSITPVQTQKLMSRIKDMAGMDESEKRRPQDGEFSHGYRNRVIECRVSTQPAYYGEKCIVRILDREKVMLDVGTLGIRSLDKWKRISKIRNGLILVCGATGSGKTTTLYSTLQSIDTLHKAVYTIEDPVEYKLPFVTQVKVNRDTGVDFASFTRSVLRNDPDIIIVGEVRDNETAENAIHLADTGHLVYATLHTNDVPSSLIRLQRMGVDLYHLAFVLRGILVQQLARKICKSCHGHGCIKCEGSGYMGMTLISEFAEFKEIGDVQKLLDGKLEYQTFTEDIKAKVQDGITDCKEIRRVTGSDVYLCQTAGCVSGRGHCLEAVKRAA